MRIVSRDYPKLVVDVGESLLDFEGGDPLTGRSSEWTYPIAVGRLRAALAFVDDPLPECRKLATSGTGVDGGGDTIRGLVTGALHELASTRA